MKARPLTAREFLSILVKHKIGPAELGRYLQEKQDLPPDLVMDIAEILGVDLDNTPLSEVLSVVFETVVLTLQVEDEKKSG